MSTSPGVSFKKSWSVTVVLASKSEQTARYVIFPNMSYNLSSRSLFEKYGIRYWKNSISLKETIDIYKVQENQEARKSFAMYKNSKISRAKLCLTKTSKHLAIALAKLLFRATVPFQFKVQGVSEWSGKIVLLYIKFYSMLSAYR